ncbi:phosphoribosyltransferase [Candidatus Beckwithbacteria bacterium]|nr:phosphoribosyltransferase [Candidatus Beckwithbacteria bacterium]
MFVSRTQAGQQLAQKLKLVLQDFTGSEVIVLSIPRGGVVVGRELATALACQHDIIVTRKLQSSGDRELALGAVGSLKGSLYLNEKLLSDLHINHSYLEKEIARQQQEIDRRTSLYRQNQATLSLAGKTVIIADDGAATGATIIAAAREVWEQNPHQVLIAVPVLPLDTLQLLEKEVDAVYYLEVPQQFFAVGQFYQEFPQVSDEEVAEILCEKI